MTGREFETFFRRYYLPLGMYALRIVDDADTAEDLVENAFVKAWEAVDSGREIDNFKAYMYLLSALGLCAVAASPQKGYRGFVEWNNSLTGEPSFSRPGWV